MTVAARLGSTVKYTNVNSARGFLMAGKATRIKAAPAVEGKNAECSQDDTNRLVANKFPDDATLENPVSGEARNPFITPHGGDAGGQPGSGSCK